jgi:hypothetical protein
MTIVIKPKIDLKWCVVINEVENYVDEIEINCQIQTIDDSIICNAKHIHIGEINNKLKAIIL